MRFLRNFVLILFVIVTAYSAGVFLTEGPDFVTPYLNGLLSMTWQGQFTLDFTCYLMLSGLWVAWRGGFDTVSIGLGLAASTLGLLVFAPILLHFVSRSGGDLRVLLLGVHAEPQS